jgi:hypothetical protein
MSKEYIIYELPEGMSDEVEHAFDSAAQHIDGCVTTVHSMVAIDKKELEELRDELDRKERFIDLLDSNGVSMHIGWEEAREEMRRDQCL